MNIVFRVPIPISKKYFLYLGYAAMGYFPPSPP